MFILWRLAEKFAHLDVILKFFFLLCIYSGETLTNAFQETTREMFTVKQSVIAKPWKLSTYHQIGELIKCGVCLQYTLYSSEDEKQLE